MFFVHQGEYWTPTKLSMLFSYTHIVLIIYRSDTSWAQTQDIACTTGERQPVSVSASFAISV